MRGIEISERFYRWNSTSSSAARWGKVVTSAGIIAAKVVKVDAANDLALLKAEGRFAALPVVASRAMRLGSTAATVGFPNVAQNCILLYRRIVFGRASAISRALQNCHGLRVANPRDTAD